MYIMNVCFLCMQTLYLGNKHYLALKKGMQIRNIPQGNEFGSDYFDLFDQLFGTPYIQYMTSNSTKI